MDMNAQTDVDLRKLEALTGKVMTDAAGAGAGLLAYIGDQTGVYRAMVALGRALPAQIASEAGVDERYLREWLGAQAAAGYVTFHGEDETWSLSPEQALVFAAEGHPACMQGYFQLNLSLASTYEKAVETFRTGAGRGWGEHSDCLFCGVGRFFETGYKTYLLEDWIPALDGVAEKLQRGAKVADVGCGHGSSTILMAQAWPLSRFEGLDFHAPSIAAARVHAEKAGVARNTVFKTAGAADYEGGGYDLVCLFDALHDMGDPVGAARHIRQSLKPDGALMLVEPLAGDSVAENLHLIGQIFYQGSTLICTPAARAQGELQLGAQAGEKRLTAVLLEAGFTRVRRATQTMTNMILEARP